MVISQAPSVQTCPEIKPRINSINSGQCLYYTLHCNCHLCDRVCCSGELRGRLVLCARLVSVLLARCRRSALLAQHNVYRPWSLVAAVLAWIHYHGHRTHDLADRRFLAQSPGKAYLTRCLCWRGKPHSSGSWQQFRRVDCVH